MADLLGFRARTHLGNVSVLDREEQLPGTSSGDVLLKVTNSLDRVLWPAWAASDVIEHGLSRYRLLSASP